AAGGRARPARRCQARGGELARTAGARADHGRRGVSGEPIPSVAHARGRPLILPRLPGVRPAVPRAEPRTSVTPEAAVPRTPSRRRAPRWRMADTAFRLTALAFALSVLAITGAIAIELFVRSAPARHAFGWSFLWTSIWDPVFSKFGALPFIYGT